MPSQGFVQRDKSQVDRGMIAGGSQAPLSGEKRHISHIMQLSVKVKPLGRVRLCDPVDCSPPGSSVHGILQARVLEWAVISFSRGSS